MGRVAKHANSDARAVQAQEKALSDIYEITSLDGIRYNPDDLIGRKGFHIYKKMMLDEQVKAVVRFRRDAITSRKFYFTLETENLSEEEIERRKNVVKECVNQMKGTFTDVLNGVMSSTQNGYSLTEKTFKPISVEGRQYWGIKKLTTKPFDTFYFDTDEYGHLRKLVQKVAGREIRLDISNFIHYVANPEVDEYYGQSELRECYRNYFSKDIILRLHNIYLEKYATGFNWMTPPEGKKIKEGSEEHTQLLKIMRNIQAGTGILLPSGFELHTQFPSGNPGFEAAVKMHDMGIAKSLLVPNLLGISSQEAVGSFAQSKTQLESFLWMLDADAAKLEEILNEQLFIPLGRINFGDELTPLIRLRPLSKTQIIEVAKAWGDLISGGATRASQTDEEFIRDMMGFPSRDAESDDINPDNALSGQQIDGLVSIVEKVAVGTLTKDTARQIILAAYPIPLDTVDAMLDKIPITSTPHPAQPPAPDTGNPPARQGGDDVSDEETIIGDLITVSAFTRAAKRVDFAVIAEKGQRLEETYSDRLAQTTDALVADSFDVLEDKDALSGEDATTIAEWDFPASSTRDFREVIAEMLDASWRVGEQHARNEIDKARGEDFSLSFSRGRMEFIQSDFFDIKAFTITGSFVNDMLSKIKNLLLNGAKGGKPTADIRKEIVELAISEGVVSRTFAEQELGERLQAESNPMARLNTIVRNGTFESINEARYSYFSDPQNENFVEALEYSAILDRRTTSICRHLDGRVYPLDGQEWQSYRPPNHHNCRSLLIPVTAVDQWSESEPPTQQPQKGFE